MNDLVSNILLAEFDPDAGSIIKNQFPCQVDFEPGILAEYMLPEGSHARENDSTIFFLPDKEGKSLYGLSVLLMKREESLKRGAKTLSLAIIGKSKLIYSFKPLLLLSLEQSFFNTIKYNEKLEQLYQTLNHVALPPPLTPIIHRLFRSARLHLNEDDNRYRTSAIFNGKTIPFQLPIAFDESDIGGGSLISLIKRFGKGIVDIYHALLFGKRIIFLGFQETTSELCSLTLSSLLMMYPLMGYLSICIPYLPLSRINELFERCGGYVIGVNNPIYSSHNELYDVLCNIHTGEVFPSPNEKNRIIDPFISYVLDGIEMHYSEEWVRCQFHNFTQYILNSLTSDFDSEMKMKYNLVQDTVFFQKYHSTSITLGNHLSNIKNHIKALEHHSSQDFETLFEDLLCLLQTDDQILEFISLFQHGYHSCTLFPHTNLFIPPNNGLYCLAIHLFNNNEKIKNNCFELLHRIDSIKESSDFISRLNYFLLLTYLKQPFNINDDEEEEDGDGIAVISSPRDRTIEQHISPPQDKAIEYPRKINDLGGRRKSQIAESAIDITTPIISRLHTRDSLLSESFKIPTSSNDTSQVISPITSNIISSISNSPYRRISIPPVGYVLNTKQKFEAFQTQKASDFKRAK